MPVLIAAVLEVLVYLFSIPLHAAFALSTEGGLRWGFGLSAFQRRAALRRARRFRPMKKARGRKTPGLSWRVLRRLRGARLLLRGRLGLGDAAATALACGTLRSLAASMGAQAGRVEVDVAPMFADDGLVLELQGMIRLRTGQIMTAIAMTQIENFRRRIARWINTQSKA